MESLFVLLAIAALLNVPAWALLLVSQHFKAVHENLQSALLGRQTTAYSNVILLLGAQHGQLRQCVCMPQRSNTANVLPVVIAIGH